METEEEASRIWRKETEVFFYLNLKDKIGHSKCLSCRIGYHDKYNWLPIIQNTDLYHYRGITTETIDKNYLRDHLHEKTAIKVKSLQSSRIAHATYNLQLVGITHKKVAIWAKHYIRLHNCLDSCH